MNYRFLVVIALLASLTCRSQSFQFENYSIEKGMPSNEAYHVYQDKKGFIWFATDNGVVRFDGKEMKTYHVKQGLVDPVIFGFHEDKKGRLWFRSYSGKLAYYYHDSIFAYRYNQQISTAVSRNLIHSIYYDENEALWLIAGKEILKIDKQGKTTRDTVGLSGLIYKTVDSAYLIGLTGPIPLRTIYINNKIFQIPEEDEINSPVIQSIEWNGKLLLSASKTIYSYDGTKVSILFRASTPIISLSKDLKNNLWVGYRNQGVDRIANDQSSPVWKPPFLTNQSVTKVMEDNEGGLWFTTLEKGAYYVPKSVVQNFFLPDETKITAVTKKSGIVLAGDLRGNLYAINSNTNKIDWRKSFGSSIISLFVDQRKNLWVSTSKEIFKFNKNFALQPSDPADPETKIDFFESPEGVLWAVGGSKVVRIDSLQKSKFNRLKNIYRAICATDSNVYLAGRTGLEIYSKKMEYKSSPPQLLNLKITDIQRVNDTTLFLATSGNGFVLFNEKTLRLTRFDSENNLMANTVYSTLLYDSLLWLGTENGVIKTNATKLLRGQLQFKYLNRKSGLASNKVNHLVKVQNSIWVFTENGISIIPDSLQNFTNTNPAFYLKSMTVNQVPFNFTKQSELRYDQNDITISFGFISFNNNESIQTRFRLSPTDPWVYAESRDLQFFSLSPGTYALTLEYSIDNNEWKSAIDQLKFSINPPWWKAWYYQLAAFLLISLFGLLYFRSRLLVSRQKQQYLAVINNQQQKLLQTEIQTTERERSRIAKDLHDTVGTNLAALKMMISQLLRKHHEPLAENVETQLLDIIKETKEIIYNLVPPGVERFGLFVLAKNHVAKLNRSAHPQIELTTSGRDVFNADLNIIIFRVIQELISNSLKHAHASSISVGINTFDNHVNILYEDNGVGFSGENNTEGFGLLNIQSRVDSLQGDIKFESGYSGTAYTINIPYAS